MGTESVNPAINVLPPPEDCNAGCDQPTSSLVEGGHRGPDRGGGAPRVKALTLTAPPPGSPTEGVSRVPSGLPRRRRWCAKRKPVLDRRTGRRRYYRCGRAKCSVECRRAWARKWSAIQRRSYGVLPPTHMVRITVQEPISDAELTRCISRFLGRLKRRGHEYLIINEWKRGKRHHHILVRAAGKLTRRMVREFWSASCPGKRFTRYCARVIDPVRVARYVVKDTREGGELPPEGFRGRVISSSEAFFSAPTKVLWAEQRTEWDRQRRER